MQHKDIRSYIDSALFILGICIVIRQAFALDNFNDVQCIDQLVIPSCNYIQAYTIILLIVGVEGILSPFGGLFINASYILGIVISTVGVIMSIVFMIAFRNDEKFQSMNRQLIKAAYSDFVLNMGACFGLLYANATNWRAKSQVELSNEN